ncbi:MAG: universal stress protein, partial [Cyanobacteria bacterium P01_A01_bin.3]
TICEIAKDWDADAIAIGRRGLGAIGELLVGSVSSYVMHHAHCSVFVINNRAIAQTHGGQAATKAINSTAD